jgi:hypothetical protein
LWLWWRNPINVEVRQMSEEKDKVEKGAEKTGKVIGKGVKKGIRAVKVFGKGIKKGVEGDQEKKD